MQELGRLGRSGRMAGEFHWLHQVSVDTQGNIYTAEVDTGKRIQKFIRYGGEGCSGTGSVTVGRSGARELILVGQAVSPANGLGRRNRLPTVS